MKHLRLAVVQVYGDTAATETVLHPWNVNGLLTIGHRVPFADLACMTVCAVLLLVPQSQTDQQQCEEYSTYFRTKCRAGVARLGDPSLDLYVLPLGAVDAAGLLKGANGDLLQHAQGLLTAPSLQTACLVGVLARNLLSAASASLGAPKPGATSRGPAVEGQARQQRPKAGAADDGGQRSSALATEDVDIDGLELHEPQPGEEAPDGSTTEGDEEEQPRTKAQQKAAAVEVAQHHRREREHGQHSHETDAQDITQLAAAFAGPADFVGDWVDSLGNYVSVQHTIRGIEVILSKTLHEDKKREVRLTIKHGHGMPFVCGHYELDQAESSASKLTWHDARKAEGSRPGSGGSTSIWKRRRAASQQGGAEGPQRRRLPSEDGPSDGGAALGGTRRAGRSAGKGDPPVQEDDLSSRIAQLLGKADESRARRECAEDSAGQLPGGEAGGAGARPTAPWSGPPPGAADPSRPWWGYGFQGPCGSFHGPSGRGWPCPESAHGERARNHGAAGHGHRRRRRRRSGSARRRRKRRSSSGTGESRKRRRARAGLDSGLAGVDAGNGGTDARIPAQSSLALRFQALVKGLEELGSSSGCSESEEPYEARRA